MTATAGYLFEGADWDFSKLQRIHDLSIGPVLRVVPCWISSARFLLIDHPPP
jgi:hypothetical protein